ncbi:hydrolase [Leptospira perolatii]|uniref:Hydrolase n=1 Tax=Leptospira perolatii TaxID=2023191 RepID=A0A2M9ZJ05_9LEPT|nr:NlpC/P60 family protein [Leptospira perolatii]PJZ69524.1 hydrolase [Leptospira perolatii]PJZ72039.1 hydrolase [Leptospira perolatii]
MKFFFKTSTFFICLLLSAPIFSDPFSDLLKEDFNAGQTLLIRNSVFQKLGSRAETSGVRTITKNLIPWAIMEGMVPEKVADLIVKVDYAEQLGVSFEDAEDTIPISVKRDLSNEDFAYIGLFFREAKIAGIQEPIRNRFLEAALEKKWDGLSILAGGRALAAGKLLDFPENRFAYRVLNTFPSKGKKVPFSKIESAWNDSLQGKSEGGSAALLSNLRKIHAEDMNGAISRKESVFSHARSVESSLEDVGSITIGERPKFEPVQDPPLVPDIPPPDQPVPTDSDYTGDWTTVSTSKLRTVVKEWVGSPYKWAGESKSGVDCSGFTYKTLIDPRIGVPTKIISHGSSLQLKIGTSVQHSQLNSGDLIFFSASPNQSKITHVGLILSTTEFSHASSTRGVVIDKIQSKWWVDRYVLSRRPFKKIVP